MTAQPDIRPDPAAELGFADATRLITAQHAAGVSLDEISAHHHDVSASLWSDAQTAPGRAYADAYSATSESLIADLIEDAGRARGAAPMAARLRDGTPHADPRLAARGWQVQNGVYVRREPQQELEAG